MGGGGALLFLLGPAQLGISIWHLVEAVRAHHPRQRTPSIDTVFFFSIVVLVSVTFINLYYTLKKVLQYNIPFLPLLFSVFLALGSISNAAIVSAPEIYRSELPVKNIDALLVSSYINVVLFAVITLYAHEWASCSSSSPPRRAHKKMYAVPDVPQESRPPPSMHHTILKL